jgi:hypothetical protein
MHLEQHVSDVDGGPAASERALTPAMPTELGAAPKAVNNAAASVTVPAAESRHDEPPPKAPPHAGAPCPHDGVHVIFSTDCSAFQNWQSIVVYYSAEAVGQPGPVTRIASGCAEEEQRVLREMHRRLSPQFRVHFTPDYSKDPKTGKTYLFFNKPHGLLHWLTHAKFNESVVALLDPDMLFLRPITGHFPPGGYLTSPDWKQEHWERVVKGKPAGQQYGLG